METIKKLQKFSQLCDELLVLKGSLEAQLLKQRRSSSTGSGSIMLKSVAKNRLVADDAELRKRMPGESAYDYRQRSLRILEGTKIPRFPGIREARQRAAALQATAPSGGPNGGDSLNSDHLIELYLATAKELRQLVNQGASADGARSLADFRARSLTEKLFLLAEQIRTLRPSWEAPEV
jgi:hypothetical protein